MFAFSPETSESSFRRVESSRFRASRGATGEEAGAESVAVSFGWRASGRVPGDRHVELGGGIPEDFRGAQLR